MKVYDNVLLNFCIFVDEYPICISASGQRMWNVKGPFGNDFIVLSTPVSQAKLCGCGLTPAHLSGLCCIFIICLPTSTGYLPLPRSSHRSFPYERRYTALVYYISPTGIYLTGSRSLDKSSAIHRDINPIPTPPGVSAVAGNTSASAPRSQPFITQ